MEAVGTTDHTPPTRLSPVFAGISVQHRDTVVLRHRYRRSPPGEYHSDEHSVYPIPGSTKQEIKNHFLLQPKLSFISHHLRPATDPVTYPSCPRYYGWASSDRLRCYWPKVRGTN